MPRGAYHSRTRVVIATTDTTEIGSAHTTGCVTVTVMRTQVDGTEDGIKMTFGDNGVSCRLSKRLPDYVKTNVADFVDEVGFGG